ncbi:AraC family transcriptional regulator [Saccharopolyspora sp. NPDC049357]|uniref:AraC family transcriptional regulator n=1 Tax=Saccharopolyspora sp. NPDC049357 TaxID=3154507 RepID=UPI0034228545
MSDWDLPRAPASALVLTGLGVENGVPHEVSLRGTRLDPDALADTQATVTAHQELQIIRNLLNALGEDVPLGIEAGMRYHLTTHGIWGFALSSSPTLRSAIAVGLRYVNLTFAFTRMSAVEQDDGMRLVLDGSHLPSDVRRFLVEREMASSIHLARQLLSDQGAVFEVHFRHAAPPASAPHEKAFGMRPTFQSADNAAVVPVELLDRPLPQADAHTAAVTEDQCRRLLADRRARAGIAGTVRDRLAAQPGDMPDIETVAAELHMSSRSLRRRLTAEGTSYRALADEVREHLAEELLATKALSVEEIGRRLGYAATPAFTTAFKRWKGMSPQAYARR